MREQGMYSWGNPWFRWSVVSLAALTVVSLLVGFVWLPSVHGDFSAQGLWASICRAAGVPTTWSDGCCRREERAAGNQCRARAQHGPGRRQLRRWDVAQPWP